MDWAPEKKSNKGKETARRQREKGESISTRAANKTDRKHGRDEAENTSQER